MIFDRPDYVSTDEFLDSLRLLEHVMFMTKEVKSGRGRHTKISTLYKYRKPGDDQIRDKIKNSIKYYERNV
jgi:hypothetical protein